MEQTKENKNNSKHTHKRNKQGGYRIIDSIGVDNEVEKQYFSSGNTHFILTTYLT
jgi:hypothetical protein